MLKHRNEAPDIAHYFKSHPRKRKNTCYSIVEPTTHSYSSNYNYNYFNTHQRNMHLPFHHQNVYDENRQPQSDVSSGFHAERRYECTINPHQSLDIVHSNLSFDSAAASSHYSSQTYSEKHAIDAQGEKADSNVGAMDFSDELFDPIPWDIYRNEPVVGKTTSMQLASPPMNQFHPKNSYMPQAPHSVLAPPGARRFGYDHSGYPPVAAPPYVPSSEAVPITSFSSPYSHCPPHPYQYHYVNPNQEHSTGWLHSRVYPNHCSSICMPTTISKSIKSNLKSPVKKSKNSRKRQPRPKIFVVQGHGGVVFHPRPDDILSGRGGRINSHIGNVRYRQLVAQYKQAYLDPQTKKLEKSHIAADIVNQVRQRGGRFLAENQDGSWHEVGDVRAIRKTGQALREVAQPIRISASNGSHDDTEQQESVDSVSTSSATSSPRLSSIDTLSFTDRMRSPDSQSAPHISLTDSDRNDSIGSLGSLLSVESSKSGNVYKFSACDI